MWWLHFFINFTIYVTLRTLARVLALLLPSKSEIVKENVLVSVQYTRPYTLTNYEERKWNDGKRRVSMAYANGVITLGESEVRA